MLFIPIKTEIKFINKYNVSIKIIIIIEDIKFLKKKIKVVKREIKIFFLSEIITEIYNIPKNLITEDVIIKNNDHMFITNISCLLKECNKAFISLIFWLLFVSSIKFNNGEKPILLYKYIPSKYIMAELIHIKRIELETVLIKYLPIP